MARLLSKRGRGIYRGRALKGVVHWRREGDDAHTRVEACVGDCRSSRRCNRVLVSYVSHSLEYTTLSWSGTTLIPRHLLRDQFFLPPFFFLSFFFFLPPSQRKHLTLFHTWAPMRCACGKARGRRRVAWAQWEMYNRRFIRVQRECPW